MSAPAVSLTRERPGEYSYTVPGSPGAVYRIERRTTTFDDTHWYLTVAGESQPGAWFDTLPEARRALGEHLARELRTTEAAVLDAGQVVAAVASAVPMLATGLTYVDRQWTEPLTVVATEVRLGVWQTENDDAGQTFRWDTTGRNDWIGTAADEGVASLS